MRVLYIFPEYNRSYGDGIDWSSTTYEHVHSLRTVHRAAHYYSDCNGEEPPNSNIHTFGKLIRGHTHRSHPETISEYGKRQGYVLLLPNEHYKVIFRMV